MFVLDFFFFSSQEKWSYPLRKASWQACCGSSKRMRFCFTAKFTEFPRNVTATEGQNVEMSCAFQSGSASVYLEIQWWFLRGPEGLEPAAEVAGAQVEDLGGPHARCVCPSHSLGPLGVRAPVPGCPLGTAGSLGRREAQGRQGVSPHASWRL